MATAKEQARRKRGPTRRFDDYDAGNHFRDRVECDRRPITEDLSRRAVENGSVEDNPVDRDFDEWRFRLRVDGLDVVVAAGESKAPGVDLRIFTAFVDVADPAAAWVSDRWSEDAINVAAMLQCLNAASKNIVDGFSPRRIHVHEPVPYHGHVVVWNDGFATPFCLACEHESDDGDAFERRPCF